MELKKALLFESGQAEITPAGRRRIGQVGKLLPDVDQRHQIAIEGHTDDVPIHTGRYDSNWELSSARATVVLKTFLARASSPHRLSAQGFADTRPAHARPGRRRRADARPRRKPPGRDPGLLAGAVA